MGWWKVVLAFGIISLMVGCAPAPEEKIDLTPDSKQMAQGHLSMGLNHLGDKPSMALKEFLKADSLDPNNPDILAALAKVYEIKKAYGLAEETLKKALVVKPNEPNFHNNLGALYIRLERWDDAIASFDKAASNLLFDRPELAYTGMGFAYQKKENYVEAKENYQTALEFNPSFPQAWLYLGETAFALGETEGAVDHYQKAIGLAPNFTLAHYRLGLAYLKLRKTKEAIASFEETVRLAPGSTAAREATNYLSILR